jgi:N-acetylglucosaminyldiphosphoundecaprenol N-acetyl-beta-D-mannosaminyltransferase
MSAPASSPSPADLVCAGVSLRATTPTAAARLIVDLGLATDQRATGIDVHLCNAYTLALADRDDDYRAMLNNAGLNLPDGAPVAWASSVLHRGASATLQRVRGPSLFTDVFALGQDVGLKHYLLGSTPHTLELLIATLQRDYPRALIVGSDSPPFRALTPDEANAQGDRIAASGAHIVWVGLGTPKQDWACADLASQHPQVFVAIGAAFDFAAGTVATAPPWMQEHGLEWAHRLASEPRRLWRRYLIDSPRFVKAAITRRS